MKQINIALFQCSAIQRSLAQVYRDLENAFKKASKMKVDLIVTPELYLSGYSNSKIIQKIAQSKNSEILKNISLLAKKFQIGLVLGYPEKVSNKIYNSAIVFDDKGNQIFNYRKLSLPNDFEKNCFSIGNKIDVFKFKGIKCSILICYDVEFPELTRKAAQLGAELVIVPTALRKKWRIVSEKIIPTRAYENSLYLAYCDYANGKINSTFSGGSTVCAPDGNKLTIETSKTNLIYANIDTKNIIAKRKEFNFLHKSLKNNY